MEAVLIILNVEIKLQSPKGDGHVSTLMDFRLIANSLWTNDKTIAKSRINK